MPQFRNNSFGSTDQLNICFNILSLHVMYGFLTILLTQIRLYIFDGYCLIKAQACPGINNKIEKRKSAEAARVPYPAID